MDVSVLGPGLTLLGTFGGVWVIVALFNRYQADFTGRYRTELVEERAKREAAETEADSWRAKFHLSQIEVARLQGLLALNNIKDQRGS